MGRCLCYESTDHTHACTSGTYGLLVSIESSSHCQSSHSSYFGDICALYPPFLHQLTVQSSLFEPGRIRPCPSYSRRRDRINLGLLRSLYKGGGVLIHCLTVDNSRPLRFVHGAPWLVPGSEGKGSMTSVFVQGVREI